MIWKWCKIGCKLVLITNSEEFKIVSGNIGCKGCTRSLRCTGGIDTGWLLVGG